jgi:hypothetical protein
MTGYTYLSFILWHISQGGIVKPAEAAIAREWFRKKLPLQRLSSDHVVTQKT